MHRYLIIAIVTAVLWETLSCKAGTQPPPCIPNSLPEVSKSLNSIQQNNVIVIGKIPARPYVVAVPGQSDELLNLVRNHIADAFLAQHRLGIYVYAGASSRREEAECLSHFLRSEGLDARVVYFHQKTTQ